MSGTQIGYVTHYFRRISVAAIALTGTIKIGDKLHFFGRTTDFQQDISSLQIDHQHVEIAGPDQEAALRVAQRVRRNDKVFKLVDED